MTENRLAKGTFVRLGRPLEFVDVTGAVCLLAGDADDITTRGEACDGETYLGTPKDRIKEKLVPGGHIRLFMGS